MASTEINSEWLCNNVLKKLLLKRMMSCALSFLSRHVTEVLYKLRPPTGSHALTAPSVSTIRWHSSVPEPYEHLTVKSSALKDVCILEMKKKPVNSLGLEFLTELNIALEKLTNDKTVRGVIITSALPVFSAGLDIMELYQPKEERLRTFWHNVQELALNMYCMPKAVISAIDGACIAGGCIFAWSSDYRIMSEGKHTIGLNETQLGIAAPFWLADLAVRTMGLRNAEKMLQLGETYPAQRALELGAIDEICKQGQALDVALDKMKTWVAVADSGRQVTKHMVRHTFLDTLQRRREEDKDTFCNLVTLDSTQRLLGKYVEALKKKSK